MPIPENLLRYTTKITMKPPTQTIKALARDGPSDTHPEVQDHDPDGYKAKLV